MTIKPDDIPQDVWGAALDEFGEMALAANLAYLDEEIIVEGMARAILAERERCAKIVDGFGDAMAIAGPNGEFLSIVPSVAAAIRKTE